MTYCLLHISYPAPQDETASPAQRLSLLKLHIHLIIIIIRIAFAGQSGGCFGRQLAVLPQRPPAGLRAANGQAQQVVKIDQCSGRKAVRCAWQANI